MSRHHHISPLAVAVIVVGGTALALNLNHNGFLKSAFHKDILAKVDQADILTAADMVPEQPAGPVSGETVAIAIH